MKTWEMIKALTEDKSLKFIDENGYVACIRGDSGIMELLSPNSGFIGISGNLRLLENTSGCRFKPDKWKLVRQEVDFMAAINSGKNTKPSSSSYDFMSVSYWLNTRVLSLEMINGKWLIE